jgi:hypothetical protein
MEIEEVRGCEKSLKSKVQKDNVPSQVSNTFDFGLFNFRLTSIIPTDPFSLHIDVYMQDAQGFITLSIPR